MQTSVSTFREGLYCSVFPSTSSTGNLGDLAEQPGIKLKSAALLGYHFSLSSGGEKIKDRQHSMGRAVEKKHSPMLPVGV